MNSKQKKTSGHEKAPGAATPRALDNVKTTEELSVKMNHSISLYRGIPSCMAGEGGK